MLSIGLLLGIAIAPAAMARELTFLDSVVLLVRVVIPAAIGIYALIITILAVRKNRECKRLLKRIAADDPSWQPDSLKRHIETTFERLHMAIRHRNPELDRAYLSESLHASRSLAIERMRRDGVINRMEGARITNARIVEVLDFDNNDQDTFTVLICGRRANCEVHARSATVLGGEKAATGFRELWTFRRETRGWLLDEIDDSVTITELREAASFVQSADAREA